MVEALYSKDLKKNKNIDVDESMNYLNSKVDRSLERAYKNKLDKV